MVVLTFDTHAFIKQLKEAGFPEPQAEALSEAIKRMGEAHLGELATKRDLEELKLSARHDLKELELRIDGELRLLKWMMGAILAGVVSLVMKAFF